MVEGLVEVVARFVVLESFAQHSGEQIKRVSTEMTTGLSDNGVSKRVVFCRLQSLDGLAVEVGRGEPSSDIHDRHLVSIVAADLEALAGEVDSFVEGRGSVHAGPAVEMDSFQVNAEIPNLLHSHVYLLRGVDVISKFAREGGGELVTGLLLDGDSPKDPHLGSDLLDLNQLVN